MTDIKQKALALLNAEEKRMGLYKTKALSSDMPAEEALCRAIEQHEAFKQEVSKVMTYIKALYPTLPRNFNRFIIPAPKPDPLVEVMRGINWMTTPDAAADLRAALDALGFEIRSKNDDQ